MQPFAAFPKKLLSTTITTLISASLLVGCAGSAKTDNQANVSPPPKPAADNSQGYCYNGGKKNEYSCDNDKKEPQPKLHAGEIDEEWMHAKLGEIRKWMAEEKKALLEGDTKAVAKTATPPKTDSKNFISTVSVNEALVMQAAPEIEHILRLSQQGAHQEALAGINAFIADHPKMASAELTKGIVLSNMGDKESAKKIFQRLTTNHPERPEAFNNLAVIYAEQGNYPKAIETLQQAFQTHPSYAQVHSNLKELYAALASQAYSKALDLGASQAGPDLAMIDQVPGKNGEKRISIVSSQPNAMAQPLPPVEMVSKPSTVGPSIKEEQVVTATVEQATTEKAPAKASIPVEQPPASENLAKVETVQPSSTEAQDNEPSPAISTADATAVEVTAISAEQAVENHIQWWGAAWSQKNHASYISAYTDNYRPNKKLSHDSWVKQRYQRLNKPRYIRVTIDKLDIKMVRDNLAEARFNQYYESNTYKDAVKKRMMLVKVDDQWKISLERSLGLIQ